MPLHSLWSRRRAAAGIVTKDSSQASARAATLAAGATAIALGLGGTAMDAAGPVTCAVFTRLHRG